MADVYRYVYEWKGAKSRKKMKITALPPGPEITSNDNVIDVMLPDNFIQIGKQNSSLEKILLGVQTPAELEIEIDLQVSNANTEALVQAISSEYPENPDLGVYWTLKVSIANVTTPLFRGVSKRKIGVKYSYSDRKLKVTAYDISKYLLEQKPNEAMLLMLSQSTDYTRIKAKPIYKICPGFVIMSNYEGEFVGRNVLHDALKWQIDILSSALSRGLHQHLPIQFPELKYYKQSGQASAAIGSEIPSDDVYVHRLGAIKQICSYESIWDYLVDLAEFSLQKVVILNGDLGNALASYGVYGSYIEGVWTEPMVKIPSENIISIETDDLEGSPLGYVSLENGNVCSDSTFSDVEKWDTNDKSRNTAKFTAKSLYGVYPTCVVLNFDFVSVNGYLYQGWFANNLNETNAYYIDASFNGSTVYNVSEVAKWNGTISENYSVAANPFDWAGWKTGLYPGATYKDRPSEAIVDMQRKSGYGNVYAGAIMKLFGTDIPTIKMEIDFDGAFDEYGNYRLKSFAKLWDLRDYNGDGVLSFSGFWAPFSYEIDWQAEKITVELLRLKYAIS